MEVDRVNPGNAYGWQNVHTKGGTTEEGPDETQDSSETLETPPVSGEESGEMQDGKGVIRLLQEAHFKGVSDVRLRINFFDELAALKTAQVEAVAEEKIDGTVAAVGAVVDSFLTENDLTQDQVQTVQELQENFIQAAGGSIEDPVGGLDAAFAAFLESLHGLFEPPAETEEPPAGDPSGEEPDAGSGEGPESTPAPEEGPDWMTFIDNLQSAFTAAMEDLTNGLSSVQILPPLSAPNGNGVAYDKFVAIYNEMRGVVPAPDGLDETEPTEE